MPLALFKVLPNPHFDPASAFPQGDWVTTLALVVSFVLWFSFVGWLIGVFYKAKRKRDERKRLR